MQAVTKEETLNSNNGFTTVCGHTIGRYAFIGAGAVVTKDVPDYALMLGNPAEVTGWMCKCGHQIDLQAGIATCSECMKQYRESDEGVKHVHHSPPEYFKGICEQGNVERRKAD